MKTGENMEKTGSSSDGIMETVQQILSIAVLLTGIAALVKILRAR